MTTNDMTDHSRLLLPDILFLEDDPDLGAMTAEMLGAGWCSILGFLDQFQYAVAVVVVALVVWYVVVKVRTHMAAREA